jgi:DNA topoisomerase-1
MMQEFYDKFHPTVKDVEANAERESGERILVKIQNKSRFVRLGNLVHGQIGEADDERKIASLMPDQNMELLHWKKH